MRKACSMAGTRSLDLFASARILRRVLLPISESRDRGSTTTLDAATVAAQTAGVAIYAVTYSALKTAFTSKAPVAAPRRPLKPEMPSDQSGSVNGMPPGKYNPYPKHLPPEQQVDALGGIGELKHLHRAQQRRCADQSDRRQHLRLHEAERTGGGHQEVRRRTAYPVPAQFRSRAAGAGLSPDRSAGCSGRREISDSGPARLLGDR